MTLVGEQLDKKDLFGKVCRSSWSSVSEVFCWLLIAERPVSGLFPSTRGPELGPR